MSQHEGMTHQPYTDNDSGLVGARLAPSRQRVGRQPQRRAEEVRRILGALGAAPGDRYGGPPAISGQRRSTRCGETARGNGFTLSTFSNLPSAYTDALTPHWPKLDCILLVGTGMIILGKSPQLRGARIQGDAWAASPSVRLR